MATQLFFRTLNATTHLGTNSAKLNGSASVWAPRSLELTRGASVNAPDTSTVAGATNGIEVEAGGVGFPGEWISPPVSADVTISGAVTGNIWASENNMSANVAINFVVDVIRATDNSIVQIVKSARVTEVAVTTRAVNNFTATPGAGVLVNRGDRIRVRVFGDDAGTMGSGFTFNIGYNGATAAADGDTYVTFTETFAFESDPAGTTLYLTADLPSGVDTAAEDRLADFARGSGVISSTTNTSAGWTAPIQVTITAGGVVDWFTKQLQAFTLTGMAKANLRFLESSVLAQASAKCEIARVNSDGASPTVWGSWCISTGNARDGELSTSEAAEIAYVSGDDLAFTDGQRIRIRVYVDDYPSAQLVTGHTVTLFYRGLTAGATGDSYVILPQSVLEFVAAVAQPRHPAISHQNPAVL